MIKCAEPLRGARSKEALSNRRLKRVVPPPKSSDEKCQAADGWALRPLRLAYDVT